MKQKNQMMVLGALTGTAQPPTAHMDQLQANDWIAARWAEYMAEH